MEKEHISPRLIMFSTNKLGNFSQKKHKNRKGQSLIIGFGGILGGVSVLVHHITEDHLRFVNI